MTTRCINSHSLSFRTLPHSDIDDATVVPVFCHQLRWWTPGCSDCPETETWLNSRRLWCLSQSLDRRTSPVTQLIQTALHTEISIQSTTQVTNQHTHTHTQHTALCPGLPGSAGTRKVKPIWILLKQEIVNGSGISWAICKSAPRSRQTTMPAPHHSDFYRLDALPATQPTASKH